jgi:hypothetical protein
MRTSRIQSALHALSSAIPYPPAFKTVPVRPTMDASNEKKLVAQSPPHDAELGHTSDVTVKDIEEDQYPHGLKLIILASASLVAVFLIALDQVSSVQSPSEVIG